VRSRGFTLVEVLVALVIVVIGLAAMMITISSTARTSGYLRDKTLAQWIALNRISEVRLNLTKPGADSDTGQVNFANRTWHFDTRYFDTSIATMKRIVVRVYPGDAKSKSNALAESIGFVGSDLSTPGSSNVDWTAPAATSTSGTNGTAGGTTTPTATTPTTTPPPTTTTTTTTTTTPTPTP
jgi:general secretion pathway protein I